MNQAQAEQASKEQKLVVAKKGARYLVGRLVGQSGSFFKFRGIGGEELPLQSASSFSFYRI